MSAVIVIVVIVALVVAAAIWGVDSRPRSDNYDRWWPGSR